MRVLLLLLKQNIKQKAEKMSYKVYSKKVCKNCEMIPTWYAKTKYEYGITEQLIETPIYWCGICGHETPRKIYLGAKLKREERIKAIMQKYGII